MYNLFLFCFIFRGSLQLCVEEHPNLQMQRDFKKELQSMSEYVNQELLSLVQIYFQFVQSYSLTFFLLNSLCKMYNQKKNWNKLCEVHGIEMKKKNYANFFDKFKWISWNWTVTHQYLVIMLSWRNQKNQKLRKHLWMN